MQKILCNYLNLCENSHSNNLTPTILLHLKYRIRHVYKRSPSVFRRFFKSAKGKVRIRDGGKLKNKTMKNIVPINSTLTINLVL